MNDLGRASCFALACLLSAACDANSGSNDGGTDDGATGLEPQIISFTAADTSIAPFAWTELSWSVLNARVIDISSEDSTLISTFSGEGTVSTSTMRRTTTFVLTAVGSGGKMATREVTVEVDWPEPSITSFIASPNPGFVGSFVSLQWTTMNAERARVLRDGVQIADLPVLPELGQGFANGLIEDELTTFTLEASNPEHTATMELEVRAEVPPEIRRFVAFPRVLLSAPLRATVSWTARGVSETQLFVSNIQRMDFPGTLTGTITLDVENPIDLRLIGLSQFGTVEAYRTIGPPTQEFEPNDDVSNVRDITYPGGVLGDIARAGDIDIYLVFVGFNGSLRVATSAPSGTGCNVDTEIVLISGDLRELGRSGGGGEMPMNGGECAVIDPAIHPFARNLFGSVFFIQVQSETNGTGSYALVTDEL